MRGRGCGRARGRARGHGHGGGRGLPRAPGAEGGAKAPSGAVCVRRLRQRLFRVPSCERVSEAVIPFVSVSVKERFLQTTRARSECSVASDEAG